MPRAVAAGCGSQLDERAVKEKEPPADFVNASSGYEAVADRFIAARSTETGAATVREWARGLPDGAEVLELGCGHGVPISRTLLAEGLRLFAVDAAPSMLRAFRERFPEIPTECAPVETAPLFEQEFDGVVAWGLVFLLERSAQELVIRRVAGLLRPGGRFLFTSPEQACEWEDLTTGRVSRSLGRSEYLRLAHAEGLRLEWTREDESGNFYYALWRPP